MGVAAVLWLAALLHAAPLPEHALFKPGPPVAEEIEVVDVRGLDHERRLPLIVLQGLVNRGPSARAYLLQAPWDDFWLARIKQYGGVTRVRPLTSEAFLAEHAEAYSGVVIYDPGVPATVNVATMIASLEGMLAASPAVAEELPVGDRLDLRGRWSANADAYRWALEELWPQMNPGVLALYRHGGIGHLLRDYLVQRRVFTIWVTGSEVADGAVSDPEAELAVLQDLYAASRPNIPVLGFPSAGGDSGLTEYVGVGLGGEYGKLTVPCDYATNLSLLSGVTADVEPAIAAYKQRAPRPLPPLERDKVYLALCIVESGDAPSYLQNRGYEVWEDPARGTVPVNWCIGPSAVDLCPPVPAYYFREATAADHLFVALSGAAYVHPYRGFMSRTPDPDGAWEEYLAITGEYMARTGLRDLALYTDAWRAWEPERMDPVTDRVARGLPGLETVLLGMGRDEGIAPDTSLVWLGTERVLGAHILTRWPHEHGALSREENIDGLVEDIRTHTPEGAPAFMAAMALSWSHDPSSLREVVDRLGPRYVPVLLPELRALLRAAEAKGWR